jgi:hypothetical protein
VRLDIDMSQAFAILANNKLTIASDLNELAERAVYLRHKEIADPKASAKWLRDLADVCEEGEKK